jgi:CheY-like chemotaxis protein
MEVISVGSGSEALELLDHAQENPFQLAIVDLHMADMDGLSLAHAIRASPRAALIRVVLLISLGEVMSGEASQCSDACLVKPVKQSSLFDSLARVMTDHSTASAAVAGKDRPIPGPQPCQDVRILLAEDNPVNRFVAIAQLKQLGYRADDASNGLEVLELLRQTPYEIILMDCQMPEMDGFEAARQIRADGSHPSRPYIIALTAHATRVAVEKCFEAGMNDYVSKPVKFSAFAAVLAKGVSALSGQAGLERGDRPSTLRFAPAQDYFPLAAAAWDSWALASFSR